MFFPLVLVFPCFVAYTAGEINFPGFDAFNEQFPLEPTAGPHKDDLESWIASQTQISISRMLANIAPGGHNVPSAPNGTIVASPSTSDPDYFYQWTRDSALTAATLVDLYIKAQNATFATHLEDILIAYASQASALQHLPNPSGDFSDLEGLGEPKFEASGEAYWDSWGRPQRDGPALRALALMEFARAYNYTRPDVWASRRGRAWFEKLYKSVLPAESVVKADLEYVARYWKHEGFDLWEEVRGLHFFTAMVQRKALIEGAAFARAFGDEGAAEFYEAQILPLDELIERFWDEEKNHLVETLDLKDRSGLDCGLLLGSIHGNSPHDGTTLWKYPPHSDEILLSAAKLIEDQKQRFKINHIPVEPRGRHIVHETHLLAGLGIGRYPEDTYDGIGTTSQGNPWFLCTAAIAEVFYHTARHLSDARILKVSKRAYPFWKALLAPTSTAQVVEPGGRYSDLDNVFTDAVAQLSALGDAFVEVIRAHADQDGALSEQFDRDTGFEKGAKDLTWSYSAFLRKSWAREAFISKTRVD